MRLREITEGVGRITKQNQTIDVGPDEVTKQAAKFGNKVDKDGRPPTLSKKVRGKSTNVLFNLGLSEGYKLQLERDKEILVLNITDTATGKRTEVRGKPGYETDGYDPTDKLHQLLDKVGRSASVSDMMNGDVVTINPKHPKGASAKTATDTAFNEALDNPYPFNLKGPDSSHNFAATAQTPNGVLRMDFEAVDYDDFSIDFAVGKSMGKTEAGDEFRVFATVVAMMNKWIKTVGIESVESIDFGANKGEHASDGRAKLYTRFSKKLAGQLGWKLEQSTTANRSTEFFKLTNPKPVPRHDDHFDDLEDNPDLEENFADGKKKVNEALNNPYPYNISGSANDRNYKAQAQTPNGQLSIIFKNIAEEMYTIDFSINQRMDRTGAGDEFRIFATVKAAILDWIKRIDIKHVESFGFSANKEEEQGQGRAKLYARFANQLAKHLGWEVEIEDGVDVDLYDLINPNPVPREESVEENFADGKKKGKSRPGRVKKSGASCNGTVTQLRKRAKNASGEKAKMLNWCANMKGGKK